MAFLHTLLADADIMLTSFRDKALKKLHLDWESVHARHPHLVWGQVRGYGEYGPEKDTKGFDATAYGARGGYLASFVASRRSAYQLARGDGRLEHVVGYHRWSSGARSCAKTGRASATK